MRIRRRRSSSLTVTPVADTDKLFDELPLHIKRRSTGRFFDADAPLFSDINQLKAKLSVHKRKHSVKQEQPTPQPVKNRYTLALEKSPESVLVS